MSSAMEGLTAEQLKFWDENGFLVIPDALSPETTDALLAESHKLLEEFSLDGHPMTQFKTGGEDGSDESKHTGDDYFINSNDKIHFFFEEDAFDSAGNLTRPKTRAINKIGHALHTLSPPFAAASLNAKNKAIARSLQFRSPLVLQSMVICKQPEIGGAVPMHQDSTFLYTDPPSAVGFWYALEDAAWINGCLSFAPGSHKRRPIKKRFVRAAGGGTCFEEVADGQGNGITEKGLLAIDQTEDFVVAEVTRGSLVLIHGNILHRSEKNFSGKSRFIYTFHVIEGENAYDAQNWLQPPAEGFSRLNDVA